MITGEPAFLTFFDSGVKAVAEQQRELESVFRDAGGVRPRRPRAADRRTNRARAAQRRAAARRRFDAARRQVESGARGRAVDRIREQLDRMNARQLLLLEQRHQYRRETVASRQLSHLAILVSVALLLAIFVALLRENRLRRRSESELDRFFTLSLDLLGRRRPGWLLQAPEPGVRQNAGTRDGGAAGAAFLDFVQIPRGSGRHPGGDGEARPRRALRLRPLPLRRGSWKCLSWRVQPFPAEGLLYATARDMHFRKRSEQELRAENAFLDSVIEKHPGMVFKDAAELRFVRFNLAGEDVLGHSRRGIGRNDYDFFPREEADFFTAKDHKAVLDIPEEKIASAARRISTPRRSCSRSARAAGLPAGHLRGRHRRSLPDSSTSIPRSSSRSRPLSRPPA